MNDRIAFVVRDGCTKIEKQNLIDQLKARKITNIDVLDFGTNTDIYEYVEHNAEPNKEFSEILDLSQLVSSFGFHTDHYTPPTRSGDQDKDKALIAKIKLDQGMPNLEQALDSDEPQEIDFEKYNLVIKQIQDQEKKLKAKQADITKWTMKQLAAVYDTTNDFQVVLSVGAEIMTRKFGQPVSKAGRPYDYDPSWIGELIPVALEKYPEKKHQWLRAYKTRCRNIIREGKNFNALRFFIEFMVKNHLEEIAPVYQNSNDTDIPDLPPELDITEDECPF